MTHVGRSLTPQVRWHVPRPGSAAPSTTPLRAPLSRSVEHLGADILDDTMPLFVEGLMRAAAQLGAPRSRRSPGWASPPWRSPTSRSRSKPPPSSAQQVPIAAGGGTVVGAGRGLPTCPAHGGRMASLCRGGDRRTAGLYPEGTCGYTFIGGPPRFGGSSSRGGSGGCGSLSAGRCWSGDVMRAVGRPCGCGCRVRLC